MSEHRYTPRPGELAARAAWRVWFRLQRIIYREAMKAALDMIVYGTGVVEIDRNSPDLVRHKPIGELFL